MLKLIGVMVSLFLFINASCAHAAGRVFTADKGRTLYVRGEVGPEALELASELITLTGKAKTPITIVINSPGGNVYTGLQLMSAIHIAQQRGVKVRCFVPVLAASMAFQILSVCDERYTLQYSLLLFHPARAMLMGGFLAEELEYQGAQLKQLDEQLKSDLAARLGMDSKEYDYHYRNETLWLAPALNERAGGDFLMVVDDFVGVDRPFDL